MAKGEPPYADLHPMRVLFLIPKNDPPELDGNWSKAFKEFVAACLKKDPDERPTSEELLKHRFFKGTKKTEVLKELVDRKKRYDKQHGKTSQSNSEDETGADAGTTNAPAWNFDNEDDEKPAAKPIVKEPERSVPEKTPAPTKDSSKSSHTRDKRSHTSKEKSERRDRKGKERERKERKPKPADPAKAKALHSIIQPSIEKVSKTTKDEKVLAALNELKIAFEMAESVQPGTSHNFVAQVIDALKKSSVQK